jgi:tetratricopeptide (TPR) repeat protein
MRYTALLFLLFLLTLTLQAEQPKKKLGRTTASATTSDSNLRPQAKAKAQPSTRPRELSSELQKRYAVLKAAVASGDSETIAKASQRVVALGLLQMANIRMLVRSYAEAIELYRKSLFCEESSNTHLNLSIALSRDGRLDEAISEIDVAIAGNPENARAWHVKGRAQVLKKDYPAAIESLSHSLSLKSDANAEFALGSAYVSSGDTAKAEALFQKMLQEYGDRAIWHVVFAGAYREAKMHPEAIREFKRAIALDNTVDHAHFFLGLTLLEQNMWARTNESMAEFREAVQQHPDDFSANFYLGVGESQLQLFDDSDKHLRAAATIQPNGPEVWLYLGLNAFQERSYEEAKKDLLKAVELSGSDEARGNYQIRRAYIALGRMYFIDGNKQEAEKWIAKAKSVQGKSLELSSESVAETTGGGMSGAAAVMPRVEEPEKVSVPDESAIDASAPLSPSLLSQTSLSPSDREQVLTLEKQLRTVIASAYNDWGTADARRELYRQALERFHEAEQWDRTSPGLMRNIGIASLKTEDIVEALRALKAAVEIDPSDRLARVRLAMTLFRTDDYGEAARHFQALGNEAYADPGIAYAWSYSLVRLNQNKQAGEVLNRLSAMDLPPAVLMNVGDLFALLENYEQAINSYRKALAGSAEAPRAHFKIGASLLRLARADVAIPELQAALRENPGDTEAQYNLAYAFIETSRKPDGLNLLRQIVEANPNYGDAHYLLGKTLVSDGQFDTAVPHLEAAVHLNPDSAYAHYQLQTAYRRLGRAADADNELKIYRGLKTQKREQVVIPMGETNP